MKKTGLILMGMIGCPLAWAATGIEFSLAPNRSGPSPETNLFADRVLARGKGIQITQSQVDEAYTRMKAVVAAQGQVIPENRREELEAQTLERLINVQVLLQRATDADRLEARQKRDATLTEYKNRAPSEEAFRRHLLVFGMTENQFSERMYEEALFQEVIDRELKSTIPISEEAVIKYYEENPDQFAIPEQVQLSQILILTQDLSSHVDLPKNEKAEKKQWANKLRERILGGEDFAKIARDHSDDMHSREAGGKLPPLARTNLVSELADPAFALTNSQISEVITSQIGYHILKLHEKMPAHKATLAEAEPVIKSFLATQETQKQLPVYLKKLRAEADIQMMNH